MVSNKLISLFVAAALGTCALAATSASSPGEFEYLFFKKGCAAKFMAFDFSDSTCLKATISKVLGYFIILGACIVKLPQILNYIKDKSTEGTSKNAAYLELAGYMLQGIWHMFHNGSPFSAYGETVIVALQSFLVVILIWTMGSGSKAAKTPLLEVIGVGAALAGVAYGSFSFHKDLVQNAATVIFASARLWQVAANFKQGHTGNLAFLTLFMQFAGSAARIFTTLQEVKDPMALFSFLISTALNGVLLGQYFFLGSAASKKKATKKD